MVQFSQTACTHCTDQTSRAYFLLFASQSCQLDRQLSVDLQDQSLWMEGRKESDRHVKTFSCWIMCLFRRVVCIHCSVDMVWWEERCVHSFSVFTVGSQWDLWLKAEDKESFVTICVWESKCVWRPVFDPFTITLHFGIECHTHTHTHTFVWSYFPS